MPISWNEIRQNAIAFSRDWKGVEREDAEAKTFWDEFFKVFGIKRRTIASFEEPVKKLKGTWGYIDCFWKGTLLVEHKSKGKPLDKAHSQAIDYIQALKNEGRDDEIPRYIIVSDFERMALHDLEAVEGSDFEKMAQGVVGGDKGYQFFVRDLHKHIHAFAFIPGYKQHALDVEDPINIKAVEIMGELHDALEAGGYTGHDLERFLVRVLFCMFAEDTGIFERNAFTNYLENHTAKDGSDLGSHLARLFQVLNTPTDKRQKNLIEELAELPYVNGDLYAEHLAFADFNRAMRDQMLRCCRFDWSRISPAVFGSLFQSVMEPKERRQVGAHYTSERDIMKLVRSLFLDELREEFEKIKTNKNKLKEFLAKLGKLTFFDPACGCGNFLVITYRELRMLELEVLKALYGDQRVIDVSDLSHIDVDAMYGIEINEFPARIAEVAMWLVDHQMNQRLSEAFGQYFVRLPLKKSAKIVNANALRIDWKEVLAPEKCSYVLGNPPFVGAKFQTDEQRADMEFAAGSVKNYGLFDYVTAWYFKASEYIKGTNIRVAFVSTNSITQGEQVGVLWGNLLRRGMHIRFAHQTFSWDSEARGKAHVHVVIIGFAMNPAERKLLYDYETDTENPNTVAVRNISPYLVEGPDTVILNRSKPLCTVPEVGIGNKPIDGGNYLFSLEEMEQFIRIEPASSKWFRPWIGTDEFINGVRRWCLWLGDCPPNELRAMPEAMKRVAAVKQYRLSSKSPPTKKLAQTPTRFHVEYIPRDRFMVIPEVSSERRKYIPIGYLEPTALASNKLRILENATLFHFGILHSGMHMAWVNRVTGRLEMRYQYSVKLVYNNYPWPENPTDKQKATVEAKAQAVLDARAAYPDSSLADLYDPLTMPAQLAKAHAELDRAVELCYRSKPFESDRERVEYLFELYEKLTAPLAAGADKPKRKRHKDKQSAERIGHELRRKLKVKPEDKEEKYWLPFEAFAIPGAIPSNQATTITIHVESRMDQVIRNLRLATVSETKQWDLIDQHGVVQIKLNLPAQSGQGLCPINLNWEFEMDGNVRRGSIIGDVEVADNVVAGADKPKRKRRKAADTDAE